MRSQLFEDILTATGDYTRSGRRSSTLPGGRGRRMWAGRKNVVYTDYGNDNIFDEDGFGASSKGRIGPHSPQGRMVETSIEVTGPGQDNVEVWRDQLASNTASGGGLYNTEKPFDPTDNDRLIATAVRTILKRSENVYAPLMKEYEQNVGYMINDPSFNDKIKTARFNTVILHQGSEQGQDVRGRLFTEDMITKNDATSKDIVLNADGSVSLYADNDTDGIPTVIPRSLIAKYVKNYDQVWKAVNYGDTFDKEQDKLIKNDAKIIQKGESLPTAKRGVSKLAGAIVGTSNKKQGATGRLSQQKGTTVFNKPMSAQAALAGAGR